MKKSRQIKILSIIALVLAIAGMSLGFAAFSSTLSISSSATVTPNDDNFSVEIIGMDSNGEYTLTDSIMGVADGNASGSNATVTNGKALTISNINVSFTEPGQTVWYRFIIKNTGMYDTYMKTGQVKVLSGQDSPIVCTPADGSNVSQSLMDDACSAIDVDFYFYLNDNVYYNMSMRSIFGYVGNMATSFGDDFVMKPNEYIVGYYSVYYDADGARADGVFDVEIADSEIIFSTAPVSY